MRKQYQLGFQGDPESFRDSKAMGLMRLGVQLWRTQRSQGGPYQLKRRGKHEEYGPDRKWRSHWHRLRPLLRHSDVGDAYYSQGQKGRTVMVRVVKRERMPTGGVTPSIGTADVKQVYREVTSRFKVTSLGVANCRRIDGSSQWSQHAWNDAWDIGGSVAELDRVAHYLQANKGRLHIRNILWRGVPAHYPSHIHVDFDPPNTGTPSCA